jgi:MFS family permease
MVGGGILCQFVFLCISVASVGVLLLPACTDLGWKTWQFTLGSSLSVAAGVFSGIYVGRFIDRHGPRLPMLVGSVVSCVCLYGLSVQTNLLHFWLLYFLCGIAGWNSYGPLVVNAVLNKWFIVNRGWALAIGSVGISLGGVVTPVVLTPLVDMLGWRAGFQILSVFALVVVPVSFLMRRTPEDHGWLPDGSSTTPSGHEVGTGLTRNEALRTTSFWLLVTGFGLNTLALTTILVHAIPFGTEAGFTRSIAASAAAFTGIGNLTSKPVWARALTSVSPRPLVLCSYASATAGVLSMLWASQGNSQLFLYIGFFLYGFGFGGTIPLSESVWATYFGRDHIGAIRGASYPISAVGSSLGPIGVGYWFDLTYSYFPAFVALGCVYVTAGLFIGLSRAPHKNHRDNSEIENVPN